jgi:hypothetical protein
MTACAGSVVSLWRYPIKSMQGEQIDVAAVVERGVLGDRAYAVLDRATGHIASAKHPRKWAALFQCRAAFMEPPQLGAPLPPVAITLPDGTVISSAQHDVDQVLSGVLGRDISLIATAPAAPTREANRSPLDSAAEQDIILEEPMALAAPVGTFFDYAPVHVLTTATLNSFQALYPAGRFDVRRFRPNIVVAPLANEQDFVENTWLGQSLTIGAEAQLKLIDPTPRCVVTTLAHDDLPHDPGILRTVSQHNAVASVTLAPGVVFPAVAGVYAHVQQAGTMCHGDAVWLG